MIKEIFSRLRAFRWQKLLIIWAVFVAIAAILFAERSGIQYEATKFKINYLPRTEVKSAQIAMFGQPVTCLLLYDSGQEGTDLAKKQFDQILLDMKVSTQAVDVHTTSLADIPEFDQYKTVVVLISDLDALGKRLIDLMNWVKDGGSVLFAMAPQKTTYFDAISPKLGILSSSWENKIAESIVPTEEFMLGGGQRYEFSDPFESSLSVSLREEATVYASRGVEGVPLVWGTKSAAGRVVVDNIGVYDKIMRGIYAASFSLLCDAAAYPVINSSVFYLDDFPSPVPGGDGTYIRRDYRMSIADFYSKVWWPDLVKLAQQYSIRFTGVMIENYEDDTQSTPVRQPDTQQFRYYGSLLLQQGGEVGFHGYNHQPLVLPDTDYKDLYSYRQWPSEDAIVAAMNELIDFQKTVLPNTEGSVYVPPSNILSAAGRKVLGSKVTRLHIMGGVDDEDYAKECYALVEQLQLKNLIFTGRVDVVQYMQKLDFTILTSISEGQPLSVLESMAARRPCVTTEVGCCRELLEGAPGDELGVAGYCVPPMYRQGLADAMEKMCASRARREEMGRIGQRRVDAYFHHEQMLANYRKMYDETAKEYHLE